MEFVTYEVAKKLKEKRYRELCLAYYTNDDTLYYNYSHKAGASYKDCYLSHNLMPKDSVSGKFIDAPTISEVLDWLRTNHGIHVRADLWRKGWYFDVINYEYDESWNEYKVTTKYQSKDYKSYDNAMLAGIEYVLDNLI